MDFLGGLFIGCGVGVLTGWLLACWTKDNERKRDEDRARRYREYPR